MALVGHQDIWKFVVDLVAITTAETTDDQLDRFSGAVGVPALAAADHLQRSVTYWTEALLRASDKKHPFSRGFQPAHILIQ